MGFLPTRRERPPKPEGGGVGLGLLEDVEEEDAAAARVVFHSKKDFWGFFEQIKLII